MSYLYFFFHLAKTKKRDSTLKNWIYFFNYITPIYITYQLVIHSLYYNCHINKYRK